MIWGQGLRTAPGIAEPGQGATNGPSATANATSPQVAAESPTCVCAGWALATEHAHDDDLDRLRDLVAGGMGQIEASKLIWGAA